jgi:hypothetical protein
VSPTRLDLNDGTASFSPHVRGGISVPDATVRLAGFGDFDGDGLEDVVGAAFDYYGEFVSAPFFAGTPAGDYVLRAAAAAPVELPAGLLAGDHDGDGDADLLGTGNFWPNDGTGCFGDAPVAAYSGQPLHAPDLDGDGDVDPLVRSGGVVRLAWNLGGLAFAPSNLGPYLADATWSFLDVDADGDLDVVTVEPSAGVIRIHEQLAGGLIAPPNTLATPGTNGVVGQLDIDGDGRLDLAYGRTEGQLNGGAAELVGAWLLGPGPAFTQRREFVTRRITPLAFGDFDGDGDVEARGRAHFQNLRYDGPEDGLAVQYGLDARTPGSAGFAPVLGSGGPTRPWAPARLVVARGLGYASGWLITGTSRTDQPFAGYRLLVGSPVIARAFVLGGTQGVPGAGAGVLPLTVDAALVGRKLDFQVVLVDPGAANGVSASNGLEIRFGDLRGR